MRLIKGQMQNWSTIWQDLVHSHMRSLLYIYKTSVFYFGNSPEAMTEPFTPTQRTSEEEDELQLSIKKFKDSNSARSFTQPRTLVSYRYTLLGDIPGTYEQAFNLERNWDENAESNMDLEPLIEGMVEVKLSKETFPRIRAPWSKALIVKFYGRTVGFNYLTFKINALWKPMAKLDCVNLGKDFFFIRFNSNEDYDKVLGGVLGL